MNKTWTFTFKIQTFAEKIYEEEWEDIGEEDRKLVYIVFNNFRKRIINNILERLDFKSTPESLIVKVSEEDLIPVTAFAIGGLYEIKDSVYLEELCEMMPYSEICTYYAGQKIERALQALILKTDVIQ